MSTLSGTATLNQARRDLFARWQFIEQIWQDERAHGFRREYLDPIDPAISKANDAISEMGAVVDRVLHACAP